MLQWFSQWESVEKTQPGSYRYTAKGQGKWSQTAIKKVLTSWGEKTFAMQWTNIGTGTLERLWNLHHWWRYKNI